MLVFMAVLFLWIFLLSCINYKIRVCFDNEVFVKYTLEFHMMFQKIHVIYSKNDKDTILEIKIILLKKRFNVNKSHHRIKGKKHEHIKGLNIISNIPDGIQEYVKYFMEILQKIKPEYIKLNGTLGFEDPFIVGIVISVLSIVNSISNKIIVNLQPDFLDDKFNVAMEMSGKIRFLLIGEIVFKILGIIRNFKHQSKRNKIKGEVDLYGYQR